MLAAEDLKSQGHLFQTPLEISQKDQTEIAEYVIKNGFSAPLFDLKRKSTENIWTSMVFRGIDPRQLRAEFSSLAGGSDPGMQYLLRYRTDLDWNWIYTPITKLVQKYAEAAGSYIGNLSRVAIILQKPGSAIPPHMDRVSGTRYDNTPSTYFHDGRGDPALIETDFHQKNNFLSLKIPISLRADSNGRPFVQFDGQDYIYNVKRNLFCMKEAYILHGAHACDFWRGIIYLDGNLNVENLKKDAGAVHIEEVRPS